MRPDLRDSFLSLDAALADGLIGESPRAARLSPWLARRLEMIIEHETRNRDAVRRARIAARHWTHLS